MTKRNHKYVQNIHNPTKIHTKTGEEIPNFKRVSSNLTTWNPNR